MSVLSAVLIVSAVGLLGGAILVVASQFMKVEEDPRIGQVQEALPGANCGACGYAGCADYATAIVEENAPLNLCIPGGSATAENVAGIMGTDADEVAKFKAIVACQGSFEHITEKYHYNGVKTCKAASAMHGGPSACSYGCIGFGDCMQVCKFDAISIDDGVAKVNPEKCTGCGACEEICPKKIIWVREESEKPVVMCANHQRGATTRKVCTAGCIGCMKCEKSCPEKAIRVVDNVARIDLEKCKGCRMCVNVCPVKAIAVPKVV